MKYLFLVSLLAFSCAHHKKEKVTHITHSKEALAKEKKSCCMNKKKMAKSCCMKNKKNKAKKKCGSCDS